MHRGPSEKVNNQLGVSGGYKELMIWMNSKQGKDAISKRDMKVVNNIKQNGNK